MPDRLKRFLSFFLLPTTWFRLAVLVMLGVGIFRHANLLLLLGDVLLVMLLLNLLAAKWSIHGLRVRRRLDDWLFARTPCPVEVQVSNPNGRARLGLRIEEEGTDQGAAWSIDRLPARDSVSWRRQVILPRRGRHTWRALRVSSGYPFGLVERRRLLAFEEDAIVLPCLGWLHRGRFLRYLRDLSAQPQRVHLRRKPQPHPAAQAEFHGLRSYRSGDSPRLIHWRTSARRGELMVREFEDEPSDNLLVVLDPTLPAESDYCGVPLRDQFEEVVSLTASLCWEWCRRRGDRLVLATGTAKADVLDGLTGPAHARRILECLALLECGMGPADPAVIARLQERRLPSALVVVVALGRSTLAEPLRHALGRRVHCLDATRTDRFDFYTPG
ncbi:MAG TPA: DUF58 domain-containing protein [Gemmataceae bacterium]|nr:DUF58 domain-containing protein [Gemmataceae bacterium]